MATSQTPFEPTSSWSYQFARYEALPEILLMPEVTSGQVVLLRDLTAKVLDKYLSVEEQNLTYKQAKADGEVKLKSAVKFFVAYMAAETGALVNLGKGKFQRPPNADAAHVAEVEAAAIDAVEPEGLDEGDDLSGWIYAFSFPTIQRVGAPYPIKIGKTANSVEDRVINQCKGSAVFEAPVILGSWKVKRVSHAESAIHSVLKAKGKWREKAPGVEWFDTTPAEVADIIAFIAA